VAQVANERRGFYPYHWSVEEVLQERPSFCVGRGHPLPHGEPSKERVGDWGGPATFGPSCVLLKRVPQGRTESGGIVLAANAGPRAPSGGVTLNRRCTDRP